jgi:hypothetical protein
MNEVTSAQKAVLDVMANVRALADSLQKLADALTENKDSKVDETPATKISEKEKAKAYTLEDVRGVLANKSQSGLTTEVKELISKYGGSKLSDINPENYADIIKEAEVLGND